MRMLKPYQSIALIELQPGDHVWECERGQDAHFIITSAPETKDGYTTVQAVWARTGEAQRFGVAEDAPAYAPRLYGGPQYGNEMVPVGDELVDIADAPIQIGEVYQHAHTGEKKAITGPETIARVRAPYWFRVAAEPHGDGDYRYLCGNPFCRCCTEGDLP